MNHIIYAYSETEAANISGDPHPVRLKQVRLDDEGRIPYLVDDGATIALDEDETAWLGNLAAYALAGVLALAAGYLIGVLYVASYGR